MVKTRAKGIFLYVHIHRKQFAPLIEFTKTFSNRSLAVSDGFDFRSGQYNPSGKFLQEVKFKPRTLVLYVDVLLHAAKVVLILYCVALGLRKTKVSSKKSTTMVPSLATVPESKALLNGFSNCCCNTRFTGRPP